MEFTNILLEYFSMFKKYEESNENDKSILKNIDNIVNVLNNVKNRTDKIRYITNYKEVSKIATRCDISSILDDYLKEKYNITKDSVSGYLKDIVNNINKGIDFIMYDIMLNLNRYNIYLMNKKVKSQDIPITSDINFNTIDVKLKDVLSYLEVSENDIDKDLLSDLSKYVNLDKFKTFAISIKTDSGMRRVLFDKLEDKNVLISIMLHSSLENVDNIIKIFMSENANINKVVSNIPSIFIKDLVSSKCKYNCVMCNYDNFVNNYSLIKENGVDFKKMLNFDIFFINDFNVNRGLVDKLNKMEASN
mgnify:FL=1